MIMANDNGQDNQEMQNEELGMQNDSEAVIDENKECQNCAQYKAGWMRATADYMNLQREVAMQRSEWVRMSEAQILEDFLPVYGNFKKAVSHANNDSNSTNTDTNTQFENWKKGIEYIMKQFGDVLKAHGIEEIKTVGKKFDPVMHEAVGENDGGEPGLIMKEIDAGYLMKGKVLKTAKVIIAK